MHLHLLSYMWLSHSLDSPCSLLVLSPSSPPARPPALQHVLNQRGGGTFHPFIVQRVGGGDPCLGMGPGKAFHTRSHWRHLGVVGLVWLWTGNAARLANFQVEQSWKQKFHWSRGSCCCSQELTMRTTELAQRGLEEHILKRENGMFKDPGVSRRRVWGSGRPAWLEFAGHRGVPEVEDESENVHRV